MMAQDDERPEAANQWVAGKIARRHLKSMHRLPLRLIIHFVVVGLLIY